MIKIAIPANMPTALTHLQATGRKVFFAEGQDFTWTESKNSSDLVIRLRSFDIPVVVGDSCDVGLCGSDVLEERSLAFGLNLEILERFSYGRIFGTCPRLELVSPKENGIKNPKEFATGTMILTEHPNITKKFLENSGLKVSILGENSAVAILPSQFRAWCTKEGKVGIQVVHGRIPALVSLGAGFGVMVNETGTTISANELKVIAKIADIEMLLVADKQALGDRKKCQEIRRLQQELREAYIGISGEYESQVINHEREI